MEKLNLEQSLVKEGLISAEQLQNLKLEQQRSSLSLVKALRRLNLVSEEVLIDFLSKKLNLKRFSLAEFTPVDEILALLPAEFAWKEKVLPLFIDNNQLAVAVSDLLDAALMEELRFRTGFFIKPYLVKDEELVSALRDYYDRRGRERLQAQEAAASAVAVEGSKPSAVEAVDLLLMQAAKFNASDVHIEPAGEGRVHLRLRVDGVLKEISPPEAAIYDAFISRIKIMSNLDITERRLPQDGRFSFSTTSGALDVRVSVIPTLKGESIVLRLLKQDKKILTLKELGMTGENFSRFSRIISQPRGIFLVTGPTGSGKTTTLYASLLALETIEKNVITIEDPVEYNLDFCRQIQVNSKINLTFAAGLRAILRHDPDIIMVGEVRDLETATIAIQAALTGHLVFSTLHTNDSPSAITRLIDLGIEPFLIASCLNGVAAQRLVRLLCPKCKKPIEKVEDCPPFIQELARASPEKNYTIYREQGCRECLNTGYSGRLGIFEVMELTGEIGRLCVEKASSEEIVKVARAQRMKFLIDDGWEKLKEGKTSPDELLRVLGA
jgi:type II secretory ATPase GspE/PulE/Tfp pilus assembly ATPase PilB-like protein